MQHLFLSVSLVHLKSPSPKHKVNSKLMSLSVLPHTQRWHQDFSLAPCYIAQSYYFVANHSLLSKINASPMTFTLEMSQCMDTARPSWQLCSLQSEVIWCTDAFHQLWGGKGFQTYPKNCIDAQLIQNHGEPQDIATAQWSPHSIQRLDNYGLDSNIHLKNRLMSALNTGYN